MNKQTYQQPNSMIINCQYSSSLMDWISVPTNTSSSNSSGSIIINAKSFILGDGQEEQEDDSLGEEDNNWEDV